MIYTITLNPAVDYFLEVDDFTAGAVNRSNAERKVPGGKGINVSRVLQRLGHKSEALGFIGGFTGDFIASSLEAEAIQTNFIKVHGDSRINVKLYSETETEINGSSPMITKDHVTQLKGQIEGLSEGDVLVLAGSVPSSLDDNLYQVLIEAARERGVFVCLDTSGEPLRKAIEAKPSLIKPNHHELGELFGVEIKNIDEALPYVSQLIEKGIEYVLISFAGEGALLGTKEGIYSAVPPKGKVQNSVGAGDSTVAGFITSVLANSTDVEKLAFAVACGSATAFSKSFCELEDVKRLKENIDIKHIK
ncbi:1-phosphofructokinase [Alkalihalophilus pseudofirmus]|uniref:Tagatose-6-phosphate kinase n=1 Tax=Alkalihalophilus pseudofirmus TaxID=79885 RepID=A0AAJ2NQL7_ALKPS|nr:1-phosphofructokinase [Alkalihalophilus pseudofirmus]MDV2886628.1 1-phosphofructokinase [Alkalihalophilus pseudofirmus]